MQAFKIFEISIKKRVFIIPFYFQSYFVRLVKYRKYFDMIYFMSNTFSRFIINNFLYFKLSFRPAHITKGISESLSSGSHTSARADDFLYRDAEIF